jgi:cardiolipin synthase
MFSRAFSIAGDVLSGAKPLILIILALALSTVTVFSTSNTVVIYALYFDTYLLNEPDEAVALMNISASPISLAGWQVTDGEGTVTFPAGSTIQPGQILWLTKTATGFEGEHGFAPDFEYGPDSDPAVPNMTGTAPTFANNGDECILKDNVGTYVDTLVYKAGNTSTQGWSGPALYPYNNGDFGLEGQILTRKLDETTECPVPDTDTLDDWAQTTNDNFHGKKVRYPGWDYEHFFQTFKCTATAHLEYWVAPDNAFDRYVYYINQANTSAFIQGYTFNSMQLAQALVSRLQAGVQVKVLLEGEPVGGIDDQEKWVAQQIENNGGEVWFMYTDDATHVHDRYDYQHSKFTILDGVWLLTGSENLNYTSLPADDKTNGTDGNRGVYIATNATALINHALDIFQRDLDPVHHKDVERWNASTDSPPVGFVPTDGGDPTSYAVQFWDPLLMDDTFDFEVVQSPENSLRQNDALLGLVARAGSGGKV